MRGRAPACPAAPLWRGLVSLGLSSNVLPDRADAAPAADRGLSPSSQYGSSLGARKVRSSFRVPRLSLGPEMTGYSNLIPARLMTSPHFWESAAISAANSSGVPPAGSSPIVV